MDDALKRHAEESDGEVVTGVLTKDLSLELPWTTNVWEDGIPVTKMFDRCESPLPLDLPAGTELSVMLFTGRHSGQPCCDFKVGRVWYSARDYDAVVLLTALGVQNILDEW